MRLRKPHVDIATQTITWDGKTIRLPATLVLIVGQLVHDYPEPVSGERLKQMLWGAAVQPPKCDGTLKVHMSHLRAVLRPMMLGVRNIYGFGYQFVFQGRRA